MSSNIVDVAKLDPADFNSREIWYLNNANSLVQNYFEKLVGSGGSSGLVQFYLSQTNNMITQLADLLGSFELPGMEDVDYSWVEGWITDALQALAQYQPERPDLSMDSVTPPVEPQLEDIPTPSFEDIPPFNKTMPEIEYPEPPEEVHIPDPGDAPPINSPENIAEPTYTEPVQPIIQDISLPEPPPPMEEMEFLGERPSATHLADPTNLFVFHEEKYDSRLMEAIQDKLYEDLTGNAIGLTEEEREAIYQRGRDDLWDEYVQEYDRIKNSMNPGFVSTGAMQARLEECNNRYLRRLMQMSFEITRKDAELALANKHFTIEKIVAWEGLLISETNYRMNRALEAAKETHKSNLEIHDRMVALFNARLQQYQTDLQAYKTFKETSLYRLEDYKARLEGARISNEVQAQKISLYQAVWDGIKAKFGIYSERLKTQQLKLEQSRLALEAHSQKVQVFEARLNAQTSRHNLYAEQLKAQGIKADVFGKEVDAYSSLVQSAEAKARVAQLEQESFIKKNEQELAAYETNIKRYEADSRKAVDQVEALVRAYGADVDLFRAYAQVMANQQNAETELYRGKVQQARNQTELEIEEAKGKRDDLLRKLAIEVEALRSMSNVMAQISSSLASAAHISASIGSTFGESQSHNFARHQSISNSATKGVNYSGDI